MITDNVFDGHFVSRGTSFELLRNRVVNDRTALEIDLIECV